MDSDTSAKKIIFFLLDLFLIMGAIASILTIDGGKWLINNPAFYQAPEGENAGSPAVVPPALLMGIPEGSPAVIPVTGVNGGRENSEITAPQTGGGCPAGAGLHTAGLEY